MTKLLKGTVTRTIFKPDKFLKDMTEIRTSLERFAFKKIDPLDIRDESTGWIDALMSFDSSSYSSLMHDRFMIFALRTDKFSFSSSQMRPHLEEAEHLFRIENNLEYVSAQQKKEIKEQVIRKLKMNSIPKVTITEVAWDMESNLVHLFTQSSQIIVRFTDIFEKSFETNLEIVELNDSMKQIKGAGKMEPVLGKLWGIQ
jgi:DNA recombination-dependent growth factor C